MPSQRAPVAAGSAGRRGERESATAPLRGSTLPRGNWGDDDQDLAPRGEAVETNVRAGAGSDSGLATARARGPSSVTRHEVRPRNGDPKFGRLLSMCTPTAIRDGQPADVLPSELGRGLTAHLSAV